MLTLNRRATTQNLILKVLRNRKKPLTAKQIAEKIGKPHDATRHALNRMHKQDTVYRVLESRQTLWVM